MDHRVCRDPPFSGWMAPRARIFAFFYQSTLTLTLSEYGMARPDRANAINCRFVSNGDPGSLGTCSPTTQCLIGENGQVQLFGTVTWTKAGSPDVVDTIQFASGVHEPAFYALLPVWLCLVGLASWRRKTRTGHVSSVLALARSGLANAGCPDFRRTAGEPIIIWLP